MSRPPFDLSVIRPALDGLQGLAREAWADRRAVSGAVAALGVGLLLGVALKPAVALEPNAPIAGQGLATVEPGKVDTEGLDLIVTARMSEEGRLPLRTSLLPSPVLADPGPAPRLYRASYVPPPEIEDLGPDEAAFIADDMPPCGDDCVAAIQPAEFE